MFLVHTRQETGRVNEGHDRQVESVAEAHHPADFICRVDIHHTRHAGRFLGNDANRSAAKARQPDDGIGRKTRLNLEERPAVHDLLNRGMQAVGFVRVKGHERVQRFRAPERIVCAFQHRRGIDIIAG